MKARGLVTEIEVPTTWDDSGTTRQTSAEYPFVYKDPVIQTGTYTALRVDWGDGTYNDYTTGTYHTHSYTSSGRFTVKYSSSNGVLPNMAWGMQNGSPKQLKKIKYANFTAGSLNPYFHNWTTAYSCNIEQFTHDYFRHYCSSNNFLQNLFRSQLQNYETTVRNETLKHNTHILYLSHILSMSNISEIPSKIFKRMYNVTECSSLFSFCANITTIPEGLFDDLTSATDFMSCFKGTGITSVSGDLFKYNTQVTNFLTTFSECNALTEVDYNLFDHCVNATTFGSSQYVTSGTFYNSPNIKSRPPKLPVSAVVVQGCFWKCSKMTGEADALWNSTQYPDITSHSICFGGCTQLTNYADIPAGWK